MILNIFIILIITILQVLIRTIWYSKFLFGKFFDEAIVEVGSQQRYDYRVQIAYSLCKSVFILFIVKDTSFLLPENFFMIILGILCFLFINNLNHSAFINQSKIALVIDSFESFFSSLISFGAVLLFIY